MDHAIFTVCALLSSLDIYSTVGAVDWILYGKTHA